MASDRPVTGSTPPAVAAETPRASHDAPPLAPSDTPSSSWWSAPAGKPIGIPDFTHELAALAALLFPAPRMMPLRVRAKARRRQF